MDITPRKQPGAMRTLLPYCLITPALLLIALFKIWPIAMTLVEGFIVKDAPSLNNFKWVFADPIFWNALRVTFLLNVIMTPLQIAIAIALALLVNTQIRGIAAFRSIYYLPVTISMPVAVIIWNTLLNPNNGLINSLLGLAGVAAQPFLTSADQALYCIIAVASWKGVGYWMMFLLAGLQNIDKEIYESARIDGARFFRTTFSITLPLLNRVMTFVLIADTTINLLLFAPSFLMTKGGPQMSTNVLMYEAYKSSFIFMDRGRAAVIMTVLLLLIAAIIAVQMRTMNRDGDDPMTFR